jgi:8-oxo-dGTP diphosphatase
MQPQYTLCFIEHEGRYLMLYRNKPPNQHMWNGVGGKIDPGEKPTEAILRETKEETGLTVDQVYFKGVVSWDAGSLNKGAMYVFIAETDEIDVVSGEEGTVRWKTLEWILNSGRAVTNIPIFLPAMIKNGAEPVHYTFWYTEQGELIDYNVEPLRPYSADDIHIQGLKEVSKS